MKGVVAYSTRELSQSNGASWHDEYKSSPYIYVGNLPNQLNEGDVITIFSQFGEIFDINLIRDPETGKSKGFGFVGYEDQRSTVLAVDNLQGTKARNDNFQVLGRSLRVDHVKDYKRPEELESRKKLNKR